MKRVSLLSVLLLIFPVSFSLAQAFQLTETAPTSGMFLISRGSASEAWGCLNTNGTVTPCGSSTYNGIPFETRKRIPAAPTIAMLHQAALHFTRADLAPVGYLKLAHELGVGTDEASILEAIEHNSLEVFDYPRVDAYLYNQALKEGAKVRWVWKPARQMDAKNLTEQGDIQNVGYLYGKVYSKRVPMQVMATMKAVLDCAPNALFLISDFEVPKPDPFLAVTTPELLKDGKVWIIQVWNEPGFGAGPQPVKTPESQKIPDLMAER